MRRYQKQTRTTKKWPRMLIAIIVCLLILGGIGFAVWKYFDRRNDQQASQRNSQKTVDSTPKINLNPATPDDKKANDAHKDELVKQSEQEAQPTPPGGNVTPLITDASQYGDSVEISAFVPSIIEDGGKCVLTATLNSYKITRETAALRNAKNTICPTFAVPRNQFSAAGTWKVTVAYSSASHTGVSEAKALEIK
jgi:cytoskeletal protein RodZ